MAKILNERYRIHELTIDRQVPLLIPPLSIYTPNSSFHLTSLAIPSSPTDFLMRVSAAVKSSMRTPRRSAGSSFCSASSGISRGAVFASPPHRELAIGGFSRVRQRVQQSGI